jgi:hypothetical protein
MGLKWSKVYEEGDSVDGFPEWSEELILLGAATEASVVTSIRCTPYLIEATQHGLFEHREIDRAL